MNAFLDSLERLTGKVYVVMVGIVAISIGLIALLIPLNLLMVKMQWGALSALHEGIEYALYAGIFLGAPWVLRQGAHVRVDVVTSALPRNLAVRLEQAMDVLGILICLTLFYYGTRASLAEFEAGTLPDKDLRIANWIVISVFAISFFLLTFEFIFRIRRASDLALSSDGKTGL